MGNSEHDGAQLMREQPTGESLLQCARDVLKNNVLPLLQGDAKRDVLMVMNAMSIAQRELKQGTVFEKEEQNELAKVMGEPVFDVARANRELVARIRAGGADPDKAERAAVLSHLRAVGKNRLLASNPKILVSNKP
jgi:stringent starvation protein B